MSASNTTGKLKDDEILLPQLYELVRDITINVEGDYSYTEVLMMKLYYYAAQLDDTELLKLQKRLLKNFSEMINYFHYYKLDRSEGQLDLKRYCELLFMRAQKAILDEEYRTLLSTALLELMEEFFTFSKHDQEYRTAVVNLLSELYQTNPDYRHWHKLERKISTEIDIVEEKSSRINNNITIVREKLFQLGNSDGNVDKFDEAFGELHRYSMELQELLKEGTSLEKMQYDLSKKYHEATKRTETIFQTLAKEKYPLVLKFSPAGPDYYIMEDLAWELSQDQRSASISESLAFMWGSLPDARKEIAIHLLLFVNSGLYIKPMKQLEVIISNRQNTYDTTTIANAQTMHDDLLKFLHSRNTVKPSGKVLIDIYYGIADPNDPVAKKFYETYGIDSLQPRTTTMSLLLKYYSINELTLPPKDPNLNIEEIYKNNTIQQDQSSIGMSEAYEVLLLQKEITAPYIIKLFEKARITKECLAFDIGINLREEVTALRKMDYQIWGFDISDEAPVPTADSKSEDDSVQFGSLSEVGEWDKLQEVKIQGHFRQNYLGEGQVKVIVVLKHILTHVAGSESFESTLEEIRAQMSTNDILIFDMPDGSSGTYRIDKVALNSLVQKLMPLNQYRSEDIDYLVDSTVDLVNSKSRYVPMAEQILDILKIVGFSMVLSPFKEAISGLPGNQNLVFICKKVPKSGDEVEEAK